MFRPMQSGELEDWHKSVKTTEPTPKLDALELAGLQRYQRQRAIKISYAVVGFVLGVGAAKLWLGIAILVGAVALIVLAFLWAQYNSTLMQATLANRDAWNEVKIINEPKP
jgi:hypothetical protein